MMHRFRLPTTLGLCAFTLVSGCGGSGAGAPDGVETAMNEAKPPTKRMAMPPIDTPETSLGTLPEGVGVALGEQAPDAKLLTAKGEPTQLSAVIGAKPTLLIFYRGGWCPYCNSQIHELTKAYPEFQARGIMPVAISVDRAEESAETQALYTIPFPILSDPDLAAHRAYRVLNELGQEDLDRLAGFGMDIEAASGRTHHTIAVPSLFLLDANGVIRWAHADQDYKVRPSIAKVLGAIDAAGLAQG